VITTDWWRNCLLVYDDSCNICILRGNDLAWLCYSADKGGWRSVLLSSLSFALFHGIFSPLVVVATFVQGFMWGWVYRRTESTIPSMVLHFSSRYLALVF